MKLDGAVLKEDAIYGADTAAAVAAFKRKRQILNVQGRIDDIVGKKTIAALDAEMLALERGSGGGGSRLGLNFIFDDQPIADVVVKFQGAFSEGDLEPDNVLTGRRISVYTTLPGQAFGKAVLVNPLNGRMLIRVGRTTRTIGTASDPMFALVTVRFLAILRSMGFQLGRVFIHGSSSGGRNAIDFAARLSAQKITPHFVAAVDAAFFQADTPSRPESFFGNRPDTIPKFNLSAGGTPNRHNFFQTLGNHSKLSLRGVLFTSGMAGEEIHGEVAGFDNQNLTRFIPQNVDDDSAHIQCAGRGTSEAERLIADELLLKT